MNPFILFDNPIFDEDCEDVDECTETDPGTGNLIHDCDPNATCTNTGSNSQTGEFHFRWSKTSCYQYSLSKMKKYLRQF